MENDSKKSKMIRVFNGRIIRNVIYLTILLSFVCCNRHIYIDASEVEAIRFLYLPKSLQYPASNSQYEDVVTYTQTVQDTIIRDRKIIDRYIGYINNLRPTRKKDNDFRCYSLIKFHNQTKYMHLGFGLYSGIMIENQQMKDDKILFRWLDTLLHSGPYKNRPLSERQ